MDMSDDKEYYERYNISKNEGKEVNDYIEVFKLRKLSSKKNNNNIEKESYARNCMDGSDDKCYEDTDMMDKNDYQKVTNDIKFLKPGKFGSQKNIVNIEKESALCSS